ncbi:MAG: shikimate dehydrogenase [Aestuariivita sp.]|nr:shikimate dehydrogenase [Aestuariivita sp.]
MKKKIPVAAVIGSPIEHSKSPLIFHHWIRVHSLQGYYVPLNVSSENLEKVIRTMPKMGFVGCNVTLPHKERVLHIADDATDEALRIGAANVLNFYDDGQIIADNTDEFGFSENLQECAPNWRPEAGSAIIIGAGGAAKAVVSSLLKLGVPKITIMNRTYSRAEVIQKTFGQKINIATWSDADDLLADVNLIVNSTSLGMIGQKKLNFPISEITKKTVVADLVYTPLNTNFLKAAKKVGCKTVDGLGMLLFQAAPCFKRWFGVMPTVDSKLRSIILK